MWLKELRDLSKLIIAAIVLPATKFQNLKILPWSWVRALSCKRGLSPAGTAIRRRGIQAAAQGKSEFQPSRDKTILRPRYNCLILRSLM